MNTLLMLAVEEGSTPEPLLLIPESGDMLAWVFSIGLIVIGCSMVLATYRVVSGPSVPDRVVSLDVIANLCVAAIAIFSMAMGNAGILIVAIVVALILFLGTTAYALYLERRTRP